MEVCRDVAVQCTTRYLILRGLLFIFCLFWLVRRLIKESIESMLVVDAEERPSEGAHLAKGQEHRVMDLPSRHDKEGCPQEGNARESEDDSYPQLDGEALAHIGRLVSNGHRCRCPKLLS